MINSLTFENFRGLKQLELPDMSQITLLTGRNNSGKSSILEGIFLFMDHSLPESFVRISNFRGIFVKMEPSSLWAPAFFGLNTDDPINITTDIDGESSSIIYSKNDSFVPANEDVSVQNASNNQFIAATRSSYTLKYQYKQGEYSENGHFWTNGTGLFRNIQTNLPNNQIRLMPNTYFINSVLLYNGVESLISDWISQLELHDKKQKIVDSLKYIEKEITNLIPITNQGQVQVFAKVADQLLPVRLAGDGLFRLLYILLAITAHPDSIVLIDEIETGFHYSMLETLWRLIAEAAKENRCQIIATTHSYECIQNAIKGISDAAFEKDFCMYRVEHKDGVNRAFRYDGEMTRQSIDMNMEVR